MQYTTLGRTGLQVSRMCLGTMNFGWHVSEKESFTIMDQALEIGLNFFDTADVYGGRQYEGVTEQILGRWLAQGGRRERIVLATKCHNAMGASPLDRGLTAYHIRRACEASLKRMQIDHIDLYQMHHVDRTTPWEETWQAMEQLVREGKISYVGSSNFAAWNIAKANEAAGRRHFLGLVSEQSKYSLATRMIELEVIPACRDYGVGIIAYNPLGTGLLGGVLGKLEGGRRTSEHMNSCIEKERPRLERYEALCKQIGEEPANVALAWMLRNKDVTAPIIGPRTMTQLTGCMRSLEIELEDDIMKQLDAIWPGPGGEAPEAYAW
jgi:aryl-alcohol dehydrogenase-like predicted oxidoreductase